jgi:hypothetical protein
MTQEQIVDNIIMDELDIKHPGSKELILSKTTKESRRLAVLSILDDDRRLFEQYKNIVRSEEYCSHYAEETVQVLRKYVQVADTEVKEHGEVMTPITLVEEMLDKLPPEVWSNPSLKWLDPCNGVGTFPSIVVKRLMVGLKDVILNECERYRHIIENMIYVCEIQPKNMFLFHTAFDREDDYELNTFFGSFLDKEFNNHMVNVWGVNNFDIVLGNPPYNKSGTTNSGNNIWPKFVDKMLSITNDNGHMCIVHPSLWRRPKHKVWNLLTQHQIIHLDIHDTQDGLRVFNAGTRYDWYVLNKIPIHTTTTVRFEDGTIKDIDLKNRSFLPNKNLDYIDLITNGKELCKVIHSRSDYAVDKSWVSSEQNEINCYPLINSIHSNGNIVYRYSSINTNGHFGIPKVIVSDSTSQMYFDLDGTYGLTSHCLGICIDSEQEGILISKAIESKKFKNVTDSIKWSNFWVDPRFFKHLNKDFYKQFVDENGNEI